MNATMLDNRVVERVLDGERITAEDAMELYRLPLGELGQLADHRRQKAKAEAFNGRGNQIVTYIVDRNINYTNVCNVYCKFCAFYRTERDADHYVLSHEEIDQKIDELLSIGGIQILMQGGPLPIHVDAVLCDVAAGGSDTVPLRICELRFHPERRIRLRLGADSGARRHGLGGQLGKTHALG